MMGLQIDRSSAAAISVASLRSRSSGLLNVRPSTLPGPSSLGPRSARFSPRHESVSRRSLTETCRCWAKKQARWHRWVVLGLVSGLAVMTAGCATSPVQPPAVTAAPGPPAEPTVEPSKQPAPAPSPPPRPVEMGPPAEASPVQPPRAAPRVVAQAPPAPATRTITLNFDNADVPSVVRTIAQLLGINYILEPTVGFGRVTIHAAGRFAKEELFPILETILEVNNLAITKAGPLYRIGPLAEARQRPLEAYVGREAVATGDRVIVQVIPLNYLPASSLEGVLRPLVSKTGTFLPVPGTNSLVVVDLASNVAKLLEVIVLLDINAFDRIQVKLYPVKHVDAEELVKDLEDLFAQLGYPKTTREPLRFLPISRLGAILVVNAFGELGPTVERWMQNLDQPATQPDQGIFVYYVENGKAANIADLLNSLFQKGSPEARPARLSAAPRAPGAAPGPAGAPPTPLTPAVPPAGQLGARAPGPPQPAGPSAPAPPARAPSAAPSVAPAGEIRIFADESTNALIIAAPPRQYPMILDTIKKLDIPKKQVVIETLVAELTLDDTTKFGLEWSLRTTGRVNVNGKDFFVTSTPTANFGTLFAPQSTLLGFSSVITATDQLLGLIQALSVVNRISVLSSPNILATDNKTAVINIGDSVPILTSTTSTAAVTGGQSNVTNTIQYQDTGIILTVTAHITEKRMVVIDIKQEVSNAVRNTLFGDSSSQVVQSPIIQKRTAETSAVVADGQTVLIGGLMSEERSQGRTGIPWLSKIPILGYLFGSTTDEVKKRELIILITPRVVGDPEDARGITNQFEERVKGLQQQLRQFRKEN